ncbi:MAG TPA: phospholipase D family protein [Verrucomicrobiae bacterium]|jgi:HKD family nuclease
MISLIHHPSGERRLGDLLAENFQKGDWKAFRAAIAFAKRSGVKHLVKSLKSFGAYGTTKISVGIDQEGTSAEALIDLLAAVQSTGEVWVVHNETSTHPTFHPKVYLFSNENSAECFIGSGNLTEGGLFTNYEAFVHLCLDRNKPDDREFLIHLEALLNNWSTPAHGTALKLTLGVIEELKASGDLLTESEINVARNKAKAAKPTGSPLTQAKKLFAAVKVKPAPHVIVEQKPQATTAVVKAAVSKSSQSIAGEHRGFVITLQNTDVGFGQKTAGAQRRSAELFIPKICVRSNPDFWGWPKLFKPDPNYAGKADSEGFTKMDRIGVKMRLGTQTLEVNWWYNPDKKDYRLRNEALRSAGNVGDILRIELADRKAGFNYYVEVIPQGTSLFSQYAVLCTQPVRNSKKKFGYY